MPIPSPPAMGHGVRSRRSTVRNERVLGAILERAAADPDDDLDRMLGDYFASGMDLEAIESAGLDAVRPFLDAIASLERHADLMDLLPLLHRSGFFAFFAWDVTLDHDDSTRNLLWLAQAGLGLPDRDGYTSDAAAAVELRSAYVDHVAAQLRNVGLADDDAGALAVAVLDLETRLAELHLAAEEKRDPDLNLNRHDMDASSARSLLRWTFPGTCSHSARGPSPRSTCRIRRCSPDSRTSSTPRNSGRSGRISPSRWSWPRPMRSLRCSMMSRSRSTAAASGASRNSTSGSNG